MIRKPWIVWLAVAIIAAITFTGSSLSTSQATATAGTLGTTFTPVADSYVTESYPTVNYAGAVALRVDGLPVTRSYLRFNVEGLSGTVTRATLRVYANSASLIGYSVNAVGDNTWNENTINYSNAPPVGGLVGNSSTFGAGSWTSVDVTALVGSAGTWNLALTARNTTAISFASRESGANAPQLLIETTSPSATTPTATPPAALTNTPLPTSTPPATPVASFQPVLPIQAAFFYPWFPRAWTQLGVYPYTNYTPSLGFYSSIDNATIDAQLRYAQQAHLKVLISSWWGQGHHTDTSFAAILGRSERATSPTPNLRWAIYYELEAKGNPTVSQLVGDLQYLKTNYFGHSGYLKVNNRPVVFVYADGLDGCAMADRWRQAKSQLGGNLYLVLKVFSGYRTCASQPDSWHQYSPAVYYDAQTPYSVSVSPGFWKKGEAARLARDPVRFESDVKRMVASGAAWQLITTWNEWGEGTSIEPAGEFGTTFLDILCRNLPGASPCSAGPTPAPTTPPAATQTPTRSPTPTATTISPPTATPSGDPVIAAAGDIACDPADGNYNGGLGTAGSCRMKATSDLLLNLNLSALLTLGDNQYEDGALAKFQQSFDPTWGRRKAITRPAVGNHEYQMVGATGYYQYFGGAAGDPGKGYYSYDIGAWHLIALNSNCAQVGGCAAGSPQEGWLRADLAAHPNACTLAYWHHPRFSSGQHGNTTAVQPLWQALYDFNADLVLNGHDHDYERFAPQTPAGVSDPARGLREIIVGTGGKNHYSFVSVQPNSEVRNSDTFGILKLTLRANRYDWQFVPEAGKTFTDSGSSACH